MMVMKSECIGVSELSALVEAIKNSDCNITINVNISGIQAEKPAPVNEPIPEPEIPLEYNIPAGFFIVPGEADLYYSHVNRALHISSGECTLKTTWKKVKEIAELDYEQISQYANEKYNDDKSMNVFLRFVTAHKEGRVDSVRSQVVNSYQHVEPTIVYTKQPVEEKPDMSANISSVDWSTVPAQVFGDMEYKECRSKIRLKKINSICMTTWDCIVKLASLPLTRLHNEIAALFNSPDHREMIHALIRLYQEDIIRDPDAFARPMVLIDTSTGYDGNKIEVEGAF